jgi:hypothetical protein
MGFNQGLIMVGGFVAVAGVAWYLYNQGSFDSIIKSITDAIAGLGVGGKTGNGGTPAPKTIKCKDGKQGTQAECDKQAKCSSGQHWDPKTKKCVKASNFVSYYTGPAGASYPYELQNVSNVV